MQTLLVVIATWLTVQFNLPAIDEFPRVELTSAAKMAELRQDRLLQISGNAAEALPHQFGRPTITGETYAVYDDASRSIYLHEDWNPARPGDSSILVHEMVHHMQNVSGRKFACGGEREKEAYNAQRAWLGLFNRSLEQEFGIDSMTVLVRTTCSN